MLLLVEVAFLEGTFLLRGGHGRLMNCEGRVDRSVQELSGERNGYEFSGGVVPFRESRSRELLAPRVRLDSRLGVGHVSAFPRAVSGRVPCG